jgi:hypothetical protein
MPFIAMPNSPHHKLWEYILGNPHMSIMEWRYSYLEKISEADNFKIALRDAENDRWTKWAPFPNGLMSTNHRGVGVDVHRSMLDNEIIIESDYPEYIDNFEASKIVGRIIEGKGFSPMYYYSGNKSIHIHIFLDWEIVTVYYEELSENKIEDVKKFKKEFIEWLRTKMISCWDTNIRKFDKDLIRATHLIRCELSKNKKGFKTFLGYTHNDLSFIPYICNEDNMIYPRLGKTVLSTPHCLPDLIEEFDEFKKNVKPMNVPSWNPDDCPKDIRKSVGRLLSDDFKKMNDGKKRAMFILVSELRRVMGDTQAIAAINDWNKRMGNPIRQGDIDYRFKKKAYTLSNKYIDDFLDELGMLKPQGKAL